jgi:IS5 family transposase
VASFIPFGNPGLFDEFVQTLDVAAFETPLMRVGKLVRWEVFDPLIQGAVTREPKGPGGRPRFDPMLMFKVLVRPRLHGLADEATSLQITDRNSFRAFLGLTPGDAVPDGQTISDFRELLIATKTFESLFDTFLAHLPKEHGLALAKEGVMVDASFAEVPRQRHSREDNALIKAGEVPPSWQDNAKVKAHKDLDARWTKKNHETHYGYKDHVKVDVQDKLILKAVITAASVHDSQALDELIDEGDRVVDADSAYAGAPMEAALAAKSVEPQINQPERSGDRQPQAARRVSEANQKRTRGHPLTEEQKTGNREKSRTRSRVEHVFAQMSGSMKALDQRCLGLKRNAACLRLTNLVYHMLRFEQIKRLKLNAAA